jgi:D-alanine-D-alanine ligase-like ATP-grasp enzyme
MSVITPNPSVDLLRDALAARGYTCEHFELGVNRNGYTRYTAPNGKSWVTQDAHIGYPFTNMAIRTIADRKDLAYDFCASNGVRVPKTIELQQDYTEDDLRDALGHKPLVVKPYNSFASRGLSMDVTMLGSLKNALDMAFAISPVALVQEQIMGDEIRFVIVDGEVKAAILRETPRLIGDGRSNLQELLAVENNERSKLIFQYLSYPQLGTELITKAGRDLTEVPAAGEVVSLGKGTMIKTGASIYNILPKVHKSYVDTAVRLSNALGAHFIVVDMIVQDYTAPQTATNYAFLEFNATPSLRLFYSCRDGNHYDVLSDLAAAIDAMLTGGKQ